MKRLVNGKALMSMILITLLTIGIFATSGIAVFADDEGGDPAIITIDLNGGIPDFDEWESSGELNEELIELYSGVEVPYKHYFNHDSFFEPPKNCEFAGFEVTTYKDGKTITAKPGEILTGLDFSKGGLIKCLWEEKYYKLTIHVSTIDGVDQLSPIIIENVPTATEFEEALKLLDPGCTMETELFTLPGYSDVYKYRTYKPITAYNKYSDLDDKMEALAYDSIDDYDSIFENTDVYYCLSKPIDQLQITIEPPVCGEETDTPSRAYKLGDEDYTDNQWDEQTNGPNISVSDNRLSILGAFWIESPDKYNEPFKGTFEGDQTYYFDVEMYPDLGYCWGVTEESLDIIGAELEEFEIAEYSDGEASSLSFIAKTRVEHDWGDWVVTKEATEEEEGTETRYCNSNSSHQETYYTSKLPKKESTETEPEKTEPVETEPEKTEPVETEPEKTEPVETEPEKTAPTEVQPTETNGSGNGENKNAESSITDGNQSKTASNKPTSQTATTGVNASQTATTGTNTTKTASATKAASTAKASATAVPKTGDENNPVLWIGVLIVALIVASLGMLYKEKMAKPSRNNN